MDTTKRKALEAAGWKVGDAANFLDMDDQERQLLDARVAPQGASPVAGARQKTSQPRVAKIERAASDVSMH